MQLVVLLLSLLLCLFLRCSQLIQLVNEYKMRWI